MQFFLDIRLFGCVGNLGIFFGIFMKDLTAEAAESAEEEKREE